jgi:hypothetical protein
VDLAEPTSMLGRLANRKAAAVAWLAESQMVFVTKVGMGAER